MFRPTQADTDPGAPTPDFRTRLKRRASLRALGSGALGAYLRFALATTRWRFESADLDRIISGAPFVFAFWHERLALLPAFWLHVRTRRRAVANASRLFVMVSANRDGRMYATVLRSLGMDVVHGSRAKGRDQKGGAAGLRALLTVLRAGHQIAIIPDGPRGPAHQAAPGVAQLAGMAGVPVVPISAGTSRFRRLSSWDSMVLPLPFARGVVVCGAPVAVPRAGWADALPAIEAGLDATQRRADTLLSA